MTPENKALARALRARGLPDAEVGRRLSPPCSRQYLHRELGRRESPPARRKGAAPLAPLRPVADFGARLKAWRGRLGLSQAQAAGALRVKRPNVAAWEAGRARCPHAPALTVLMDLIESEAAIKTATDAK